MRGDVSVPVLTAVMAWLGALVGVGVAAAALQTLSVRALPGLLLGVVLLAPVWRLVRTAHRQEAVTAPVLDWVGRNRRQLGVAWVLTAVAFAAIHLQADNLLFTLLTLPYRGATTLLFQMELFYRPFLGGATAAALRQVGIVYLHAVWLYLLSGIIVSGINKAVAWR